MGATTRKAAPRPSDSRLGIFIVRRSVAAAKAIANGKTKSSAVSNNLTELLDDFALHSLPTVRSKS